VRPTLLSLLALTLAPLGGATAPSDYRADLEVVRRFLDRDRSYGPTERARAEVALGELEERAGALSPAGFQLAVAQIAAFAQNGHTLLLPALWPHQFNRIPLQVHLFADGLFVIHAPEAMGDLRGARVVSIDGHAIDEVRRVYARYSGARETKRDEWIGFFLESPELLHAAGLAETSDRLSLGLERRDGSTLTQVVPAKLDPPTDSPFAALETSRLVSFAAENTSTAPLYLAERDRAFRASPLPGLEAHFVQLRANASRDGQEIGQFLSSVLATLRETKPRHLVVDLRFDGGGDLNTTRAFFQALPSSIGGDGRIFALTSGMTFSAGIASLGYLKQSGAGRVTIVGEPIGDHLEFWAEGQLLELPVSKAVLLFATERHDYRTGCPQADCHDSIRRHPIRVRTLEPDVLAPITFADFRAGRDPALDTVAGLLGRR
jgi:hypothetical protein